MHFVFLFIESLIYNPLCLIMTQGSILRHTKESGCKTLSCTVIIKNEDDSRNLFLSLIYKGPTIQFH